MNVSKVVDSSRVYPSVEPNVPITTPLSILDAISGRFTPTGAVWLFDDIPKGVDEVDFAASLRESLITTLNDFPQWAGQLRWAKVDPDGGHTARFNRPELVYGSRDTDVGVEWRVVNNPLSVDAVVPSPEERLGDNGYWIGDMFPQAQLVSDTPLALHNLRDCHGLPNMTVQLTLFEGGGYAIGVKLVHMLADANSLLIFVSRWAANSRSRGFAVSKTPFSMGDPVFNPPDLDARARGNVDGSSPDRSIVSEARSLPLHRYDWWDKPGASSSSSSNPETDPSRPPPEHFPGGGVPTETRAPWETWDFSRPVSYGLFHFTDAELQGMKAAARADPGSAAPDVSRLDALLAHVFSAVMRARGYGGEDPSSEEDIGDEAVYLNVSLDARRRVSPPLPQSFIGSPLFLTHISGAGAAVARASSSTFSSSSSSSDQLPAAAAAAAAAAPPHSADTTKTKTTTTTLGSLAGDLRRTMRRFTPDAMGAVLHDAAFEASPQRLWQAFLGRRHVLVTSWLRLPLYDIEFGGSGSGGGVDDHEGDGGDRDLGGGGETTRRRKRAAAGARYVHPVMPKCDGVVQVLDGAVDEDQGGRRGIDVSVYLDKEAMGRLARDQELWRFRSGD